MASFRNPQYQDLLQGFKDRMGALGQPWKLLRTGEIFQAIAVNRQPIDPALELGSDWRELLTLEAQRDRVPDLKYGDVLQQNQPPWNTVEFQTFPLVRVLRRADNPADFAIMYWCARIPTEEEIAVLAELGISR